MGTLASNLPQIEEPKTWDSLLMVESMKLSVTDVDRFRMGRITLAQASAFFGAELVKAGNPVGAALSSKAALSAQETVEATGVTSREITLEAADLQAYIDALPRLRTESLIIRVNAGHVPKTLRLENFYGPGFLWIIGQGADSGSVLDDGIVISSCSNRIRIIGFDVRGHSVGTAAQVSASPLAGLENLTADGNNFPNGAYNGVSSDGSAVTAMNVTISHFTRAVYGASIFRLINCGGSDNASGIAVEGGGVVLLSGSTPELMGGSAINRWGGMIVRKDGELI